MALESKEKKIEDLYIEDTYVIPNYQRGYAWKTNDVEQLIDDLLDAIDMKKDFYFLSSLTICLDSDSRKKEKDKKSLFVIDGQQRLITISLIMRALLDKVQMNSEVSASLIKSLKLDGMTRLTLDNEDDKKCYENIVLDQDIQTNKQFKINMAYSIVKERISILNEPTNFANFLLKNVYVIKNLVLNEEYACQIFESLNDRGVSLTAFDLIKNRLFLLSLNADITEKKIQKIQQNIKGSLGNGRSLSSNTRDYFRVYLQVGNPNKFVDDGSMYKEFKKQIKDGESVNSFMNSLEEDKYIRAFLSIKNKGLAYQSINEVIKSLPNIDYLKHYFDKVSVLIICQPVLFALFIHMDKTSIKNTLQDLYCLIVRTSILKLRFSKIQDMLANISSQMYFDKTKSFSNLLKKYLENEERYKGIDSSIYINSFKSTMQGVTNIDEKLSKDILFDICLFSKASSIQTFQKPYKEVSLEHILPKNKENYLKFDDANHQLYLNNLGNHTILETTDNTINSNDPINSKLEKTFDSEKYQNFPVVNNIKKYLVDGEWTIESIKKRKQDLIDGYVKLVKFSWE